MRILVLSEKYFPQGGGAEFATHQILKILSKHYSITLVSSAGAQPPNGVDFIPLPLQRERVKGHAISLVMLSRLKKLILNHDILYIPRTCYLPIVIAKKLNKKVIVHLHDYYSLTYNSLLWWDKTWNNFPNDLIHYSRLVMSNSLYAVLCIIPSLSNRVIDKNLLRLADVIVCPSRSHANSVRNIIGKFSGRIVFIYNPLPDDLVNYELTQCNIMKKYARKIFTYIGPAKGYKGFHIAVKSLKNTNVRARFIGITDRNLMKALKKLIPRAEVYPKLPQPEYFKKVQESYAVIFPSYCEEPLPYTLIESCILGNIPIARRMGSSEEFFKGTKLEYFLFTSEEEISRRIYFSLNLSVEEYYKIISEGITLLKKLIDNRKIEMCWRKLLESL